MATVEPGAGAVLAGDGADVDAEAAGADAGADAFCEVVLLQPDIARAAHTASAIGVIRDFCMWRSFGDANQFVATLAARD
ncbi:MAG: hypothetical protein ACREPZ_06950 [Rhodanobacteraceae bacterium]